MSAQSGKGKHRCLNDIPAKEVGRTELRSVLLLAMEFSADLGESLGRFPDVLMDDSAA